MIPGDVWALGIFPLKVSYSFALYLKLNFVLPCAVSRFINKDQQLTNVSRGTLCRFLKYPLVSFLLLGCLFHKLQPSFFHMNSDLLNSARLKDLRLPPCAEVQQEHSCRRSAGCLVHLICFPFPSDHTCELPVFQCMKIVFLPYILPCSTVVLGEYKNDHLILS